MDIVITIVGIVVVAFVAGCLGYLDGQQRGREEGHTSGRHKGYTDGRNDGYKSGLAAAKDFERRRWHDAITELLETNPL
jgi:flagellar biosynthesis/type III secretory pathway protein FliH